MPKKKNEESPEDQFKRFQKAVKDMEDSGEIDLNETASKFDAAMDKIARVKPT